MSSDAERGIYHKYDIKRTDGSSEPGGKHPDLSRDIENILSTWPCGCRSVGECFHYGPATPSEAAAEIMSRNGAASYGGEEL